jgi:hypothetical protein
VGLIFAVVYRFLAGNAESDYSSINRLNDFEELFGRIPQLLALKQIDLDLPFLGGLGLGSTINNNPYFNPGLLPQCISYFSEYEFTRYVCAFGLFGYLVILSRVLIAFLVLRLALTSLRYFNVLRASGLAYIALQLFLSASLKINDVSAGLLLIGIASMSTFSSQIIWKKEI